MPLRPLRPHDRSGWTLAELLVVLVVITLLIGAALGALSAEQRSTRIAAEIRAARADLRDAAAVLAHELRGASTADTIRFAGDTAVELFAPVFTAVACARPNGRRVLLSPLPPRSERRVTLVPADTGDLVWIWREDSIIPPGRWVRNRIGAWYENVPEPCDVDLAPAGSTPSAIELAEGIDGVGAGAPVQIVRRARHSVYRAADGAWYLGYRRCDAIGPSRCQSVQPVAGPYRARVGGTPGLRFRYLTADGSPTQLPMEVARIELVVSSDLTGVARRAPGRTALDDSIAVSIAVRNAF